MKTLCDENDGWFIVAELHSFTVPWEFEFVDKDKTIHYCAYSVTLLTISYTIIRKRIKQAIFTNMGTILSKENYRVCRTASLLQNGDIMYIKIMLNDVHSTPIQQIKYFFDKGFLYLT